MTEAQFQTKCVSWFNDNFPELRGLLYHNYNNPRNAISGARLKAQGLVFDSTPTDESWGWREARLRDPAGNEVCLMFGGKVRRFPDWRVDGRTG